MILGFGQDSAKSVKEVLLDILCGKKEWEEDILKLLSSKKAADRETAIRAPSNSLIIPRSSTLLLFIT